MGEQGGKKKVESAAYMNVFLPKLLVQTLRKRAKRKLGSRECRRGRITAQGCGSASEEERAALTCAALRLGLVDNRLALERGDRLASERKGSLDVRLRHLVYFVLCDLQKGFPYAEPCVVERCAYVGGWPVCAHGSEGGLDFFIGVVGYRERGCLCCCGW